jgi:hypothetical protein
MATSHTLSGPVRRGRRIAAATAFVAFGVIWVGVSITLAVWGAKAVESFLGLPMVCLVALAALNGLITAEIVVELFRFGTRSRSWTDKRHFISVVAAWMIFLTGQLALVVFMRQQILRG